MYVATAYRRMLEYCILNYRNMKDIGLEDSKELEGLVSEIANEVLSPRQRFVVARVYAGDQSWEEVRDNYNKLRSRNASLSAVISYAREAFWEIEVKAREPQYKERIQNLAANSN